MAQRKVSVLQALAEYRARIEFDNRYAMEVIIPQIQAADPGPGEFGTPERLAAERLRFVRAMLGADAELPIQRPLDVLINWDDIVSPLVLDGAGVHPDPEWRAEKRNAYKAGILQGLRHLRCPDGGQWALPRDFEILMNEVDSLEGPGWWGARIHGGVIFWEGWGKSFGSRETPEGIQQRVKDGPSIIGLADSLGKDYDVAGGWLMGSSIDTSFLAVYSRPKHPKSGESYVWSWRYVAVFDHFRIEIFEGLVSVLDWYKVIRAETS